MELTVVWFLSLITLLSGITIVLYFVELITHKTGLIHDRLKIWTWMGVHARQLALLVSFTAMSGSLYFSDVLGYAPCVLCWYQRILMYPQVFLFGIALFRREYKEVWRYAVVLSIIGAAIAGFHYVSQVADFSLPCSAVGYSASCSERFFLQFGYITIPTMALTAFILILLLAYFARRSSHYSGYKLHHTA